MPDDKPDDTPDEDKPDPKPATGDETDKWKALARKHEAQAKANADAARQLKEMQDKEKSESERSAEKIAQLEKDLVAANTRADRYEVAVEKGLDMVRAKRLTGATREELEADADELQTWQAGEAKPVPGKPTADLRGGGDPTEELSPTELTDIRQVVDSIPRGV